MTKEKLEQISDCERITAYVVWKELDHEYGNWTVTRQKIMKSIKAMDEAVEVYNMENNNVAK